MYGIKQDWVLDKRPRHFVLDDYEGGAPRWCAGCGCNSILGAVHKICRDEQLPPEKTLVVSGIGCSSRFPHYMKTYGFHSLHGRPLPVASGARSRRPDLHMFVVTGDGDCCAIGTAHWIHAIRYNMKMTVMLFDNNVYGLTKKQSSPTSKQGNTTNTHPFGAPLPPLNPLSVTLGITNASFVAQTVDWNPAHLYATLLRAHRHDGLSFVRIVQRCPHYMAGYWDSIQHQPEAHLVLRDEVGVPVDDAVARSYGNHLDHDPHDLAAAKELVLREDVLPIGLLYLNENAARYDEWTARGMGMSPADKLAGLQAELDRMSI